MDIARAQLARRIRDAISRGYTVSFVDAIQLRNWAASAEEAVLSLEEIARRIVDRERNADTAE